MRSTPFKIAGCCLALSAPDWALARCEGAVVLGALHDAYLATLTEDGDIRRRAAQTLLVLTGGDDDASLTRRMERSGIAVDKGQLSIAVTDAKLLARRVLEGAEPETPAFRHGRNVEFLGQVFAESGCRGSPSTASLTPIATQPDRMRESVSPEDGPETTNRIIALAIAVLATVGLSGALAHKFMRSLFYRKRQVERMPRYHIAMQLDLTFDDAGGETQGCSVSALDISRGGMKPNWPDAPPIGTKVTLPILGTQRLSQIVWANAHYAGLMFDDPLDDKELAALRDLHQPE